MTVDELVDVPAEDDAAQTKGFYADDVPFRSGVVQQQAPLHMAYTAALNGFNPPRPTGAFKYCDLGCGNGTTLNAYASLYPEAEFVGIDFNAGHVEQARTQADKLGLTNVRYIQGSFTEVQGDDLPVFDFIGMNGIYSWLDRDVLPSVQTLVASHLRPGGLFYVEYMCMPGMVAVIPMWHLMQALVTDTGAGSRDRATRSLRLLEELYNGGMQYLDKHPTAKNAAYGYVSSWRKHESQIDHFAHNAMASGFRPRFINEMAAEMERAGCVFGGRTQTALNDPDLAVTLSQAGILHGVEDRIVRELLLDFMRNERNRRDVYVRDGVKDEAGAREFLLNEVRAVARHPNGPVPEFQAPGGRNITLDGPAYDKLRNACRVSARALREADPDREISDASLVKAGHRLHLSGYFFVGDGALQGGELPEAPEQIALENAFNRDQVAHAVENGQGTSIVARAVGGVPMFLGPVDAIMLQSWIETSKSDAPALIEKRIDQSNAVIGQQGRQVKVRDLGSDFLESAWKQLATIRVPNLMRLGAISERALADA